MLGLSCDSVHSHRAFSDFLGGLDYPLLSDFHPKGVTMKAYQVWREERGNSWRVVYVLDGQGIIRWAKWIEKGIPDMEEVLAAVRGLTG